ncbi:hypothetical protein UFOVP466_16 [uncultured Caudovirales phage]|uniref:Uncharacterized protein n=1 Tax=uncultured Caudovirales phage TaxID=2100421 RepID=A0A6J5T3H5_9CAUD|nr:hypothetical protein UFOVP466_16 [uncultured Caudovirales phage]CAB4180621.1 hypothetical protein UFOVP1045_63 [uncultured Caudovirales phage]CAB4189863.1 hypothetical protein UFOVP1194_17 [uncultured Caudovirales phage]CAB4221776.1 hypothetical protein UFOVP1641_13 [uncultured Caudovirales phage]
MIGIGTAVEVAGVKDAVVVGLIRKGTRTRKALWQITYTVDDQLERDNPTGKRYSQPRFENELKEISVEPVPSL